MTEDYRAVLARDRMLRHTSDWDHEGIAGGRMDG